MTTLQRYALYACGSVFIGIALFYAGATYGQHKAGAKAQAAQTQSDQHEASAQTHAAQAAASDQQATKQQATVNTADAQVAAAKRELDRRLAALHGGAPASIDRLPSLPVGNSGQSGPIGSNPVQSEVIAQQQVLIAAQDKEIAALKFQVSLEHASAVQWKAAYDESQKALALEAIAKDAAVHEAKSSGLRAQLVRGLEGLAIGYAAGRLTR